MIRLMMDRLKEISKQISQLATYMKYCWKQDNFQSTNGATIETMHTYYMYM